MIAEATYQRRPGRQLATGLSGRRPLTRLAHTGSSTGHYLGQSLRPLDWEITSTGGDACYQQTSVR